MVCAVLIWEFAEPLKKAGIEIEAVVTVINKKK
jgi:hypothetical protein